MKKSFVFTFLFLLLAGYTFADTEVRYKIFRHEDFSVEYPDWKRKGSGSSIQILKVTKGSCAVVIRVYEAGIHSVYDPTLSAIKKGKNLIQADRENYLLEYRAPFLFLELHIKEKYVSGNGKTYVVAFAASEGQYKEKEQIVEHILGSIKLSGEQPSRLLKKEDDQRLRKDEFRYGIYGIKIDGSGLERLFASHLPVHAPEVSPDGQKIVFYLFTGDTNGDGLFNMKDLVSTEIAVVDVEGKGFHLLTDNDYWDIQPNWTSDGQHIVFASNRDSSSSYDLDLFVMDVNTGKVNNITNTPNLTEADPDCQAGKVVSTRFDKDRFSQSIWIMNEDGSDQKRISFPKKSGRSKTGYRFGDFDPSLTFDGKKVTFVRLEDDNFMIHDRVAGNFDLYVMDSDGTNVKNISNTPFLEGVPEWSPDGNFVSFIVGSESLDDRYRIYISDPGGKNRRKIMQGVPIDFLARSCSWFPDVGGEHPDIVFAGEWYQ